MPAKSKSFLYVYAYSENGYYAGVYGRTNGNGRVKLEIPTGSYKFRVYYRASNYWSDVVSVPGTDETVIKTEERPYTVTVVNENGQPVKRTWVYAYSGNGYYIGFAHCKSLVFKSVLRFFVVIYDQTQHTEI